MKLKYPLRNQRSVNISRYNFRAFKKILFDINSKTISLLSLFILKFHFKWKTKPYKEL